MYRDLLGQLESQIDFLNKSKEQIRNQMNEHETKRMLKAKENAEQSLQEATQSYMKAAQYIEFIDEKMAKTLKTRAISDKLKQLEA